MKKNVLHKIKEKYGRGGVRDKVSDELAIRVLMPAKARTARKFWKRWYVLTLCDGNYDRFSEVWNSDAGKVANPDAINWQDPLVELELYMCDVGNLLRLSDPNTRDEALAVLSEEAQRRYYMPSPGNYPGGYSRPYSDVRLTRKIIARGVKEYKTKGTVYGEVPDITPEEIRAEDAEDASAEKDEKRDPRMS